MSSNEQSTSVPIRPGPRDTDAEPRLTEAERRRLMVQWNKTYVRYPTDVRLHELFEAQVARSADTVAVAFEKKQLTYRELDQSANQLAHSLQALGVGPDVLVGICMERSLEMMIGLFGILKAGGAYVPLDPGYPKERLEFMMADTRVPVLLTQSALLHQLPVQKGRVVCLDTDWERITREESTEKPLDETTADHLAYVIYTSGSTGKPKGAMNSHRGICNRLFWMQDQYKLSETDTVLQKTPFSFDVSVWEFFWPLMTGARLVMARPGGHRDSGYLTRLINDQQVTVLHFVPSMLRVFLEAPALEERCRSVRHVICSGEALPFDFQERFFSRLGAQLHNLYGPTEAAVDVTHWTCQRHTTDRSIPIGRPIANTQIYILDADLEPVSIGEPGELYIGGVQVARGYLNRPELTAERFVPDPFSNKPEARLYRSGDLACYRSDGAIEYLGRVDHQVKIRGFRVELGEIEAVLAGHPGVGQAVVVAQERDLGERRLVAYIAPDHERGSTVRRVLRLEEQSASDKWTPYDFVSDVRDFLQRKLPEYMIPASLVLLEELPLSPNGKVDRQALPAPSRRRPDLGQPYVAPRTELQTYLANLWCDILQLEQVGVHDKFFELGGDSLQAAQFVTRLQKELGEFIYIVTVFEAPSIVEYAAFLEKHYAGSVTKRFGSGSALHHESRRDRQILAASDQVDATAIARMRECIPCLSPPDGEDGKTTKNRSAIFILAPPRSGTTLLRIMLAGHPKLFAASELQLLGFNSLNERRLAFSGKFNFWLEGTIRAIMEIKGCDVEEAKRVIEEYERLGYTTKQFYRLLQDWIGEQTLVDKSPSYVLDRNTLEKAERDFDNPLYIHLVRHPYAAVRSFESLHLDQALYLKEQPFSPRQLGELVWLVSHQNTVDFLRNVPRHRWRRVQFEDLVQRPQGVLEDLCETLGIEFHPNLLDPYKDIEKKMVDGIYPESTPMGDIKFLERKSIDPKVAESWRSVSTDNFLSDMTWELASSLGYEPPSSTNVSRGDDPDTAGRRVTMGRRERLERYRQGRNSHDERDR